MAIKVVDRVALDPGKAATPRVGLMRLERLARILEEAHQRYKKIGAVFKSVQYAYDEVSGKPLEIQGYDQTRVGHPCGTPACAIGHYAYNTPQRFGWSPHGDMRAAERFYGSSFQQAAYEFSLTNEEVDELFGGRGCGQPASEYGDADEDNLISALDAAKYIRKFVARKRKELGIKKPAKKK